MSARRALLIGVPENKKDPTLNLPVVQNDIELMQVSLEACGYVVTHLGVDDPSEVSANLIEEAISESCSSAPEDSTLLLYFSGHGIHYNGKDFIVPWDGSLADPSRIERSLVSTDISAAVNRSRARLIVFFVDACREGVQWQNKSIRLQGWGRAQLKIAEKRHFLLVYSCRPGELSQYVSGPESFSLFTKALSAVLSPANPSESLEEILQATQKELDALIRKYKKNAQHLRLAGEQELESPYLQYKISDGQLIEGRVYNIHATWVDSVKESRLWRLAGANDPAKELFYKEQACQLTASCVSELQKAEQALANDPWRDLLYPQRTLACLEMLINSLPNFALSYIEAFALIVSPFVKEAIYQCAVSAMAQANPLNLSDRKDKDLLKQRRKLLMTHSSYPQLVRKAQQVRNKEISQAIASWLMHRSIQKDPDAWQSQPDGHISVDFDHALNCCQNPGEPILSRYQLLEYAQCLGCDPGRIERKDRTYFLQERIILNSKENAQELREQLIGYLLCIAGWMALDIRSMSDVLPDHIGVADPINPESLHDSLRSSNWKAIGTGRTLDVQCDHPAIDYALRDLVDRANGALSLIQGRAAMGRDSLACLVTLPTRLLSDQIKPRMLQGKAAYETPHLKFQLANDEVRELLMGEALYDRPELAIRELYQNALDACRYRLARLQYLERTGQLDRTIRWQGRIEFEQGTDRRKRRFLECRDNGIGMGRREIEECFARAGKRFSDLPEFIEEQNEWLRCNPPIRIYPNSQFGIGVFSYFMLADELEVETCRMDRKGRPGMRLLITIPGSGSLFRIQELGPGKDAGTRVRLYLRNSQPLSKLSCVDVLIQLLWVSEFETHAKEKSKQATWKPNVLRHPSLSSEKIIKNPDLPVWWTTERGQILADGIIINIQDRYHDRSEEGDIADLLICGLVVNLTGEYKPKLTVDRRKARAFETNWVLKSAQATVPFLVSWTELSYTWIWLLLSFFPEYEELIHRELIRMKRTLSFTGKVLGSPVPLNVSYHEDTVSERIFGIKRYKRVGIYTSYSGQSIDPQLIGLSKINVSQVGVKRLDGQIFLLVWEAWNYDLSEDRYGFGFEKNNAVLQTRKTFEPGKEKEQLLDLQIMISKWARKRKDDLLSRLHVWRQAGLILPAWFEEALDGLAKNGLNDHYTFTHIPRSRLAWRRTRKIAMYHLTRLKLNLGRMAYRVIITLFLTLALFYLLFLAVLLARRALQ